ncbi:glycoside hydrolase family 140 protein [Brucella sp. 21LCYQ03]|nr:glycoside hydrolase family 140 protein [Brucella sp. 21LCYQ03]
MRLWAGFIFAMLLLMGAARVETVFPIKVSHDHRFFEDTQGRPFLINGDTAWSLLAELKRDDAKLYLQDRSKSGFNAILVNLIEHQFSSNPPANAYGDKPFTNESFGTLNPNYFDHAAWVIEQAQKQGLVVFLAPAYLGVNGGDQGWFAQAQAAGPAKMKAYGEAIARRFAKFPNIVWVLGGDFDAPDRALVSELAQGIASVSPDALQTVHSGRDTNTVETWGDQSWLSLDTVYTYDDVHKAILARSKAAKRPVILLEGAYEYERETTARMIRRNAYGAILGGAAGQFFGNNPIWHFSGPGVFTFDQNWREALDSPGAKSMTVMKEFFDKLPWSQLQPDRDNNIAMAERTYAAALPDQSLIVVYGDAGEFCIKTSSLNDNQKAFWVDPASGQFLPADKPKADGDVRIYQAPPDGKNVAQSDWILLVGSSEQLKLIQKA